MMRGRKKDVDAPGQDSFLDIVSNLVGILIILVMVIGVRAKNAMVEAEQEHSSRPAEAEADVSTPQAAVLAVQQDIGRVMQKLAEQQFEVEYRRRERNKVLTMIKAAEATLEQHRSQLDEAGQEQFAASRQAIHLQTQLEDLKRQRDALANAKAPPTVIEHMPTPLAKTVFGKEIHFRLLSGRLVYVPLDELVEKFKNEARQNVWKLKETPAITETVGPIRGFRLRYTLARVEQVVQTRSGQAMQQRVELDHFVLLPVDDQLGETVDAALRNDSEFLAMLSGHEANRTTVTLWVYPDSYADFRRVRDHLLQLGFLTASRPLPAGQLISGSPEGTRSAAQ